MQTRYITEQYIKNNIETHERGALSNIRTYSIHQQATKSTASRYVELTGYKYHGQKGMVIGVDRYYRTAARQTGLPMDMTAYTYVVLTEAEAKAMHNNIATIRGEIKAEARPRYGEEVYVDYTVNENVFISVRRTAGNSRTTVIHLWVKGEKYTLKFSSFPKKLKKFLDY